MVYPCRTKGCERSIKYDGLCEKHYELDVVANSMSSARAWRQRSKRREFDGRKTSEEAFAFILGFDTNGGDSE